MKNIKRFLGLILIPLSFIVPKNRKQWLFGSNMGYTGNAKHLFLYIHKFMKENIKVCWITDKKNEIEILKSKGLPVQYKWSVKGLYYCLSSKVYLFNSYISDINEYTFGNVIKINLWHGVGIKHIERTKKIPEKKYVTKNPFVKFRYFRFLIKPDFVLSTSPLMTDLFSQSFGIEKNRCIEGTYPRNELFRLDSNALNSYIEEFESDSSIIDVVKRIQNFDNRIIYMPTWRDSKRNFLEQIGIDLVQLNSSLKRTNSCILFKLHPATKLNIDVNEFSNIILLDNHIDIYPLLPFTNCLITDYSSIYYDYILMSNKRIILYIPDYNQYISGDRDLAFPFDENVEGEKIYNFNDLIHSLDNKNLAKDPKKIEDIKKRFWSPQIVGNESLVQFIANEINLKLKIIANTKN